MFACELQPQAANARRQVCGAVAAVVLINAAAAAAAAAAADQLASA
jgi:hypothetical protein